MQVGIFCYMAIGSQNTPHLVPNTRLITVQYKQNHCELYLEIRHCTIVGGGYAVCIRLQLLLLVLGFQLADQSLTVVCEISLEVDGDLNCGGLKMLHRKP